MVKGAEFRRRAPKCPEKSELQLGKRGDETEISFLRKVKPGPGFTFHLIERKPCRQEHGRQADETKHRISEIASFICNLEGTARHIAASKEGLHPWHADDRERVIGSGLEAF